MSVDRAKVLEAELFEHHPAVKTGFDAFLDLEEQSFGWVAKDRNLAERFHDLIFHARVDSIGTQTIEVGRHAAYSRANGHFVVVENDQHFAV